jgi:hypothetical protein
MSYMKNLISIIETWVDPEEDPTRCELLKDEINEHLRGKKKFHDMSILAQMCVAEWEEDKTHEFKKGAINVLNRR